MKGFHSPEAEGSWEITHEEMKEETEQLEKELEPVKGNATPAKGWRTINALSEWIMPKKQMIDSKGNTWEWEETPEVVKAVQRLHNDYRELHEAEERAKIKREDDQKGYDTYSK